jgi:hypothetical protein
MVAKNIAVSTASVCGFTEEFGANVRFQSIHPRIHTLWRRFAAVKVGFDRITRVGNPDLVLRA